MKSKTIDAPIADFVASVGLLIRRLRGVSAPAGLSLTQIAILGRLEREGPATNTALARAEGITPQSMGAVIAALEGEGHIRRRPHPNDGRQVMIALTDKGARLRNSYRDVKLAWLADALQTLDEAERRTLLAAGEIMKKLAGG